MPAAGEAAARPGLIRLARRLRERGARAYAGIAREWLNDAGTSFFDRVRALAADITRRASAGTEIERKYLLERLPDEALDAPSVEIEQGYLPTPRVRRRAVGGGRVSRPHPRRRRDRACGGGHGRRAAAVAARCHGSRGDGRAGVRERSPGPIACAPKACCQLHRLPRHRGATVPKPEVRSPWSVEATLEYVSK